MRLFIILWQLGLCFLIPVIWTQVSAESGKPGPVTPTSSPIADVHLHYNWDQRGETSPEDAIRILKQNNVVLAMIMGNPPELALEIRKAGGTWIVPFFSPYLEPGSRNSWFRDERVLPAARKALESGLYKGIGEAHLVAGLGPRRDNPVFTGLIELAIEFDVPFLVHIETSSYKYFLPVCKKYSRARFQLAHAGGLLDAKQIGALLAQCNNVWPEFSARDPWRYIHSHIVDDKGQLLDDWKKLIAQYPDRFMVGSDPVWPIEERHWWDKPDTGWQKLGEFLGFHRKWLAGLPDPLRQNLEVNNALKFYRVTPDSLRNPTQ